MLVRIFTFITAAFLVGSLCGQQAGQTYYLQSQVGLKNKVVGLSGNRNANGAPLILDNKKSIAAQRFTLEDAKGGYFYLRNGLGRYVHVEGISNQPQAKVVLWSGLGQRGANNTKWKFVPIGNNLFLIQSAMGTWLDVQWAKDAAGTPIWMWSKNEGVAQQWRLNNINDYIAAPSRYKDVPAAGRLKYILNLCPNTADGHMVSGNRHLDGEVNFSLNGKTYFNGQKTKLYADINYKASAVSTPTKIEANWRRMLLYEAPSGYRIVRFFRECGGRNLRGEYVSRTCPYPAFNGSKSFSATGTLPPGDGEAKPFSYHDGFEKEFTLSGEPYILRRVKLIGDTGSEDVSDDRDCTHDSKIVGFYYSRGGSAIQTRVEGDLMVRIEPISTTPNRSMATLKIEMASISIHNNDCTRLQGTVNARLIHKTNGKVLTPINGQSLIDYRGGKSGDFDFRKVANLRGRTLNFNLGGDGISQYRLELSSNLRGCHKSGDFASDYNCNLTYNRYFFNKSEEFIGSWSSNASGGRVQDVSLTTTNAAKFHSLKLKVSISQ